MEKASSFVSGSGLKLPIGFRFRPTDEELVVHYLRRKALGIPFPASVVPELDVFQADPWGLPGDLREKRHFFSNKPERNLCGRGRIRGIAAAGSGCWKVSSKSKRIFASENGNQAIGMRKTLVFREGKHSNRHARSGLANNHHNTQWIMHEFRLVGLWDGNRKPVMMSGMENGDWAVYRLFQKKLRPHRSPKLAHSERRTCPPTPPLSPCWSSITDAVSFTHVEDQEDVSSRPGSGDSSAR